MADPAIPRLSASLLLLRDRPFEVLMVRRSARGSFASALVFPGGVIAEDDRSDDWLPLLDGAAGLEAEDRALRICALRETFEEVGMLTVVDAAGTDLPAAACAPGTPFRAIVEASGGRLPIGRLTPLAHWITPETAPKRFDTRFYLMAAPADQNAVCDGDETVEARWVSPSGIIAGGTALPFPTLSNLTRVAESDTVARALEAARGRPLVPVLPVVQRRPEGAVVVIPSEAGYADCEYRPATDRIV